MRLANLLQGFFCLPSQADCDVLRLTLDSRCVQDGDVFFAMRGTKADGCLYIDEAIKRGAVAVIIDANPFADRIIWRQGRPLISIDQLQNKLSAIAARFYDDPVRKLHMIGVTGTNGKTSCAHFIAQVLQQWNVCCGLIGTLGHRIYHPSRVQQGPVTIGLTTPDAITLQATLRAMMEQGTQAVAMEVSSHGIEQGRVNAIEFVVGLLTNLTQDHLDYHGSMEHYAAVKKRFLIESSTQHIVINVDDAYGRDWLMELMDQKPTFAYALSKPLSWPSHVHLTYATHIEATAQGINACIHSPWGSGYLTLPLWGQFNLSNALAVLTTLCVYGLPFQPMLQYLACLQAVPGRMQVIGGQQSLPLVVVDYAHTPDALGRVLQTLRIHCRGRLICVFGCGGERDASKRPLMAAIAEKWADFIIITNDNPRHESPEKIVAEMCQGLTYPERVVIELDREQAIGRGIQFASGQDCVLIAGKGAECYQQIGDHYLPFVDMEQAKKYLAEKEYVIVDQ